MPCLHNRNRTAAHNHSSFNHLDEVAHQAAIAAEAARLAELHLAQHFSEEGRRAAQEAERARLEREKSAESEKRPMAHKFRQWCREEMRISMSTGYKYVKLGRIKIFHLGGCTMITDEESRRVQSEGISPRIRRPAPGEKAEAPPEAV
jgi:hypothetical protein